MSTQIATDTVPCPFCPVLLQAGSLDTDDLLQKWLRVGEGNEIYQNECLIAGIPSCGPCAQAVIVDPEIAEWLVGEVQTTIKAALKNILSSATKMLSGHELMVMLRAQDVVLPEDDAKAWTMVTMLRRDAEVEMASEVGHG